MPSPETMWPRNFISVRPKVSISCSNGLSNVGFSLVPGGGTTAVKASRVCCSSTVRGKAVSMRDCGSVSVLRVDNR